MTAVALKAVPRPSPAKDPQSGRFKSGNIGGPGRPKGARNKLGEAFFADLFAEWEQHGADVISRVREEDPATFLKVVASVAPKELQVTKNPLEAMSDDELEEKLQCLQWILDAQMKAAPDDTGS